jgi:hypothetical protein
MCVVAICIHLSKFSFVGRILLLDSTFLMKLKNLSQRQVLPKLTTIKESFLLPGNISNNITINVLFLNAPRRLRTSDLKEILAYTNNCFQHVRQMKEYIETDT